MDSYHGGQILQRCFLGMEIVPKKDPVNSCRQLYFHLLLPVAERSVLNVRKYYFRPDILLRQNGGQSLKRSPQRHRYAHP